MGYICAQTYLFFVISPLGGVQLQVFYATVLLPRSPRQSGLHRSRQKGAVRMIVNPEASRSLCIFDGCSNSLRVSSWISFASASLISFVLAESPFHQLIGLRPVQLRYNGGPFNGQCCSASGLCGTASNHCGGGCQLGFGRCNWLAIM
jgi:hypothetical protein